MPKKTGTKPLLIHYPGAAATLDLPEPISVKRALWRRAAKALLRGVKTQLRENYLE
jgi:hypothetical protein